jgi:hypothetical protein
MIFINYPNHPQYPMVFTVKNGSRTMTLELPDETEIVDVVEALALLLQGVGYHPDTVLYGLESYVSERAEDESEDEDSL